MMMPMHDRPADCRYRLDRRMGANNWMGTNNWIDANDWIDANNRRNMNRSHANDRGRGDADNRRDISAGHSRCRDQQQCGRDDFSHGLLLLRCVRQRVAPGAAGVGRACWSRQCPWVKTATPQGQWRWARIMACGSVPGDAAIHRE